MMNQPSEAEVVEAVIRRRRTEKVLLDPDHAEPAPVEVVERNAPLVRSAIEAAGWAPFHYPRGVDGVAEPWRARLIGQEKALETARHLRDNLADTGKLPMLLAGCNAAVLVTWLPETDSTEPAPEPRKLQELRRRDEEHLAAASAFVQNLLLLLTAHGMGTYWSSGGGLRSPEMYTHLGIPAGESFLAAVFIEYPELASADRGRKPGALRDKRSTGWLREPT
ncbi:MAG: nitroreductase family protein [Planctomycetota bacterium]